MRTSVDLPAELLQKAKIAAIERGSTLKELISVALRRELERPQQEVPVRRARFPIFRSRAPGTLKLTAEEVARLEDEEETRRHGISD